MKAVTAIMVDLDRAPLGQRSRLCAPLCGVPVLRRTVERALRAVRPVDTFVLAPSAQNGAVRDLLSGLSVHIESFDAPPPPSAAITRAGRQWGLDGWRGGIGGLCAFDEDIVPLILAGLAQRESAEIVATVAAHAALIAPDLIDAMIAHHESLKGMFRMSFTAAPPGLAPTIFTRQVLAELTAAGDTPGTVLSYSPQQPGPDLLGRDCCYRPAAAIGEAHGRLLADTLRSFSRVEALVNSGAAGWDALRIIEWMRDHERDSLFPCPEEIEIELTTQDAWGAGEILRPRSVEQRGPISINHIRCIAESFGPTDDVRIVLGGFGEPLLHPQLPEIVRTLREAGAMAIAIRSSGLAGDESLDEALFALPVDVLCIMLDAATPECYQRVHGVDGFTRVTARVEQWARWREQRGAVRPLLVPEFMKSQQTLAEMEPFFDHWTARLGWASIVGYSHCGGQREDFAVTRMAPPRRMPCRRLWTRMMVLADGRVTACDQDFAGCRVLGSIQDQSLGDIWKGPAFAELRRAHESARYDAHPICAACSEWHRP